MKFKFQKFSLILVFLLVVSVGFNIAAALTDGAEPGSDQDPLISKSYVDKIMEKSAAEVELLKQQLEEYRLKADEAKQQADDQLKKIDELKGQVQAGGSEGFIVVTLESGQTLLPGSGTEIILRSGKAVGVLGQAGDKLADVTSAKDLDKGAAVAVNHLLISSRDDGRGLKATEKCWLLVRGAYKITEPQEPTQGNQGSQGNTGSTGNTGDTGNTGASNTGNQSNTGNTTADPEPPKGKVNVSSALNVRKEPNTNAEILAKVYKGDTVWVLSTQGEWINIKTAAGIKGWVMKQYVTMQ